MVRLNEELTHARSELARALQQLQQHQHNDGNRIAQASSSSSSTISASQPESIIEQGQGIGQGIAPGQGLVVGDGECTTTLLLLQDRGMATMDAGRDKQTTVGVEIVAGTGLGAGAGIADGAGIGVDNTTTTQPDHQQQDPLNTITINNSSTSSSLAPLSTPPLHGNAQGSGPTPTANKTITSRGSSSHLTSFSKWFGWLNLYTGLAMVVVAVLVGLLLLPKESSQDEGMFE